MCDQNLSPTEHTEGVEMDILSVCSVVVKNLD